MAILLKDGSIFFHVPKTGGNWITDVLQKQRLVHKQFGHKHSDLNHMFHPTGDDALHLTLKGYNAFRHKIRIGQRWMRKGKPFMFCFVRHPISWYESWFKYMSQDSMKWRKWGNEKGYYDWHPNSPLNGLGHSEFNQFMRNILKARPGYVTEMYSAYTTPMIDFIGRQENIREDLIQVLRQLNLKFDEEFIRSHPEVGVSRSKNSAIVWDSEIKEDARKLEYAGIVRYGYS